MQNENKIGLSLRIAGGIIVGVGVIAFFLMAVQELIDLAFVSLASCAALGLMTMGLGEAVKLLQKLVETTKATALNTKITAETVARKPKAAEEDLPSA